MKDIIIDQEIVSQVGELVLHVAEQATNVGGQMDDMGRLILFKDSFGLRHVTMRSQSFIVSCARRVS